MVGGEEPGVFRRGDRRTGFVEEADIIALGVDYGESAPGRGRDLSDDRGHAGRTKPEPHFIASAAAQHAEQQHVRA